MSETLYPLSRDSAKPIDPERVASRSPVQDSGCRSTSTVLSQDCLGPLCRRGELGDDPVQGRHGRDVQSRTDDDCGQCLIEMAVQYASVSRHW